MKIGFRVDDDVSKAKYAIKAVNRKMLLKRKEENILREAKALQILVHESILKLYAFYEEPSAYYLVLEFTEGGHLLDRIAKQGVFAEQDSQSCVQSLVSALAYLHQLGIVHRCSR